MSWGLDNRLVGVRSAVGRGSATRLECRWASADANPYLVVAGCLAAGADGLEREIEVPPMVTGDPHVDASLTRLPTQLEEAMPGAGGLKLRPRGRSATCSWTSTW